MFEPYGAICRYTRVLGSKFYNLRCSFNIAWMNILHAIHSNDILVCPAHNSFGRRATVNNVERFIYQRNNVKTVLKQFKVWVIRIVNVMFSFTSFAVTAILFCNKSPIALAEAISFIIAEIKCGWPFSSFIVLRQIFPVKTTHFGA